jgi:hypothetical protein
MSNLSKPGAKTYEVGYKGYYHEHSEWYTCYIQAGNEQQALRKFAGQHKINPVNGDDPENWRWEDGDWFMVFRYIKEVGIKPCPHCRGTGVVAITAEK